MCDQAPLYSQDLKDPIGIAPQFQDSSLGNA
jgi:hypothetical protein